MQHMACAACCRLVEAISPSWKASAEGSNSYSPSPAPRAYAEVPHGLQLLPADCVFVDDQARNIAGAQAAGWRTVHLDVTAPAAGFLQALALLGVPAPA